MAAEKVDRGQLQGTVTDAALGLLENLRTTGKGDQKSGKQRVRAGPGAMWKEETARQNKESNVPIKQ